MKKLFTDPKIKDYTCYPDMFHGATAGLRQAFNYSLDTTRFVLIRESNKILVSVLLENLFTETFEKLSSAKTVVRKK